MYKLIRERDKKQLTGNTVYYVNWNSDGSAESVKSEPYLGYSLILDIEFGFSYTWLTTTITHFEWIDGVLHFTTENSKYTLQRVENN